MTALLQSESLKIRSLRSTWVFAAATVLLSAVIGIAMVTAPGAGEQAPSLAEVALGPAQLAWFVVIVLAVLSSAGEFQHRTARTTLLAAPRRVPVLAAKAVVAATTGASLLLVAVGVAVSAALVAAGTTGASVGAGPWHDWALVLGAVAVGGLWAVLATGLGILTRSTAVSITVVLLWRFVGEVLVPAVAHRPGMSRWLPAGAADALVGLSGGHGALPVAGAAALLLGYTFAALSIGGAVFVRSDPA